MAEPTGSEESDSRAEADLVHLRRCVDLATAAVDAGDEPFGSVLVAATAEALAEDRNRVGGGDPRWCRCVGS
jgi:tRNA(Arg) A34 adenosine deaminase TadA